MKTSELTGAALDWAVAKAEGKALVFFDDYFRHMSSAAGHSPVRTDQHLAFQPLSGKHGVLVGRGFVQEIPAYSTDREQGGQIIEREKIGTVYRAGEYWLAYTFDGAEFEGIGPTPLIAAMRCYVASKLGDEVEIPEELK